MLDFETTESLILEWATARNIFTGSSPISQFEKTEEEVRELEDALQQDRFAYSSSNDLDIKDAIGDIMVTLTTIAHMKGFSLTECYAYAYNDIKDRKGTMVNGVFVKEKS
tara:strand:+ start:970 stop:1299 length:330 start_codon:yes stop_codon:yes gene_type:complete